MASHDILPTCSYTVVEELIKYKRISLMPGKLIEPKVITDYNNQPVCILPKGFYFDDQRWEMIWALFEKKGESLTMEDLHSMFHDDETLQPHKLVRTGELDFNK